MLPHSQLSRIIGHERCRFDQADNWELSRPPVWQTAMDLVVEVYRLAKLLPKDERFGLGAQLRRAAVSVPANIAEGHGRLLRGEYLHHLSIARGSLKELETLLSVSERLNYLSGDQLTKATKLCDSTSRMLTRLRAALRR